jgi:hypothetical protein
MHQAGSYGLSSAVPWGGGQSRMAPLRCERLPSAILLLPACLQENILAESSAMLPDTRQRLEEAFRDLQGLVVSRRRAALSCTSQAVCWHAGASGCKTCLRMEPVLSGARGLCTAGVSTAVLLTRSPCCA